MKEEKLDLVKNYKSYYSARTTPEIVEIEEGSFLTILGKGAPEEEEFQTKVSALYSIAYTVKNMYKRKGRDFAIPKLEGLWWVESDKPPLEVPREEWRWKLLIRMPEFVAPEMVDEAKKAIEKKAGAVAEIKFEKIREGRCVQMLHLGPYSTERRSIEKNGKIHEGEESC